MKQIKFLQLPLLILFSKIVFSQAPPIPAVGLPEILPPSPDVAAFMKGGQLSTNMHTGGANASIPVYEIKMKGFSFPISINYSSSGYKPEENPSRTGIGWVLSAGGSVTRVIRGKPDDFCTTPTPKTTTEMGNYSAATLSYIEDLEDQGSYHDAQPDEFSYSVNGLSGKFIIKRDNTVLQLPYNNVKIIVIRDQGTQGKVTEVYITDDQGVKYTFGYNGVIEKTLEHNLVNNMLNKQELNTAWMLTRISFLNGEYIDFTYTNVTSRAETGKINTVQRRLFNTEYCSVTPPCTIQEGYPLGPPKFCPVDVTYDSKTQIVKYFSKAISGITTSTGDVVSFTYEDREDIGGDVLLRNIYVSVYNSNVKHVRLEYAYAAGYQPTVDLNSKFFLKKAIIKDPTGGSAPSQEFVLKYLDNGTPFEVGAGGPDHLGFATNGISSTPMPELTVEEKLFEADIVSKHPNWNRSKIGMLEKITYPTDGYDEFIYEPNMKTWWDYVDVVNIRNERAAGVGDNYPYNTYTEYFTPGRDREGEMYLNVTWDATGSEPAGNPAPKTAFAYLYVNSTSQLVANMSAEGYNGGQGYLIEGGFITQGYTLQAGVEYKLVLEVRYGSNVHAQADVVYDAGTGTEWKKLNEELCGVRVRKINSYDPVSRKTVSKFFNYVDIYDTTHASAIKLYYPDYITNGQSAMYCECNFTYSVLCDSKIYSTNSSASMFLNQAGGVTYKAVVESDDSLYANGGILHKFYTQGALAGGVLLGIEIPDRPAEMYDFRNGRDTAVIYFNKDLAVVRKEKSFYSYDSRIDQYQDLNYIFRKRYDPNPVIYPVTYQSFLQWDVMTYWIQNKWDRLDSTVTWEYDLVNNTVMKNKTEFEYATTAVIQPSAMITKGSDGIVLRKEMKYPTDLTSQAVCSTMVAKNMVSPVMEEKTYKDTKLLFQTNTDYKDWFSNATVLAPELVKQKKGSNSQETRLRYYQYDTKGNPLEVSKENDMHIVYIWDYNSTLPIAEVSNARWGQGVAYTSFEADGKGGWAFSGTPVTEGTEPVGKKSYLLSNGNITSTGTLVTDKRYFVTYWAKGTVSLNVGSPTALVTKNNWTLYQKPFWYSGSGGVTVSGSGYVDELRLFPDTAFIKTLIYTPGVGTIASADYNSVYQQYEYDVFNRLLRIRDMDKNILKQYDYKYGNDVTGCGNTSPNWTITGNYRCAKNNVTNNNNTGIKEQEEIDLNNCSETYGQLRWASMGTSGECPVTSNCTGPSKRVINGVCYTGCKQLVSSVYIGNLQWECTFRYYWEEDGYIGPEFTETNSTACIATICDLN